LQRPRGLPYQRLEILGGLVNRASLEAHVVKRKVQHLVGVARSLLHNVDGSTGKSEERSHLDKDEVKERGGDQE